MQNLGKPLTKALPARKTTGTGINVHVRLHMFQIFITIAKSLSKNHITQTTRQSH